MEINEKIKYHTIAKQALIIGGAMMMDIILSDTLKATVLMDSFNYHHRN